LDRKVSRKLDYRSAVNRVRRKLLRWRDHIKHGGDTAEVKLSPYAASGAHPTVSTDYILIPYLLDAVLRPGDVFVDVGCGRGRLLNWALDDRRSSAIFGLEIDKRVAAEVANRLADEQKVTIIAGNALICLPDCGTIFYLWNPFNEEVMTKFKDTLIAKYATLGTLAEVRIVYNHCRHLSVWERDARCKTQPIPLPPYATQAAVLITFPRNPPVNAFEGNRS
jgi:SAM-dependent methyltransferase